jgi:hypothetical protein
MSPTWMPIRNRICSPADRREFSFCDRRLNRDSRLHGIHGTGEIGDETVTRRVEDPTAMRGDQVIDDDPIRGEDAKGTDLISPHQATVALNICCEDRSELSFDGVRFQARLLPGRV